MEEGSKGRGLPLAEVAEVAGVAAGQKENQATSAKRKNRPGNK
jgi:hypothetical protein